jgi:hypothetical protein
VNGVFEGQSLLVVGVVLFLECLTCRSDLGHPGVELHAWHPIVKDFECCTLVGHDTEFDRQITTNVTRLRIYPDMLAVNVEGVLAHRRHAVLPDQDRQIHAADGVRRRAGRQGVSIGEVTAHRSCLADRDVAFLGHLSENIPGFAVENAHVRHDHRSPGLPQEINQPVDVFRIRMGR